MSKGTYWLGNLKTTVERRPQKYYSSSSVRNGISVKTYKKIGALDIPNRRLLIDLFVGEDQVRIITGIKKKNK